MSLGARYLFISASAFALVNLSVKALDHLPFMQVAFFRAFICLIITFVYLKQQGVSLWGSNHTLLILRGLAGTAAITCFYYSIHAMPLASAVTIQYLSPVFTVLFAGFLFKETVTPWHWCCALLGFSGVYLIQGFDTRVSLFGATIGVVGAIASALAYNTVRSLRHTDHEWVVMFYFPLVGSVLTAPFALRAWVSPSPLDWLKIAVVGLLTQVGQLYLTKAYQAESASKIASINYVGVLYAVAFGILFFNENLPATTAAGILLIIGSLGGTRFPFVMRRAR